MVLEKFSPTRYARVYTGKPFVSIQKGGTFWISFEFNKRYLEFIPLSEHETIDPRNGIISIRRLPGAVTGSNPSIEEIYPHLFPY